MGEYSIYRNINGVKGFFYNGAEDKSLEAINGKIESAEFGFLNREGLSCGLIDVLDFGLHLYIAKDNGAHTIFTLGKPRDQTKLLRILQTQNLTELNNLSDNDRAITMYSDGFTNYGLVVEKAEVDL